MAPITMTLSTFTPLSWQRHNMLELRTDGDVRGKDIFLNGERVGWVSYGDLRDFPADRKPVTMLHAERGTRYHESWAAAMKYINEFYKEESHV